MKVIIFTLMALMSLSLSAQETEFKILSIWKNENAPAGKTYLAAVRNEIPYSDAGDWVVIFGNQNNKVKKRAFNLGGFNFYTYDGASNAGTDDFYKMTYKVEGEKLKVNLKPRRFGKEQNVTYSQYESTGSKRFANIVIKQVLTEQERVRNATVISTLKDFKKRMNLVQWDFGFGAYSDTYEFPFPTYDLQIEFYYQETLSSKKLAKAVFNKEGTDEISKKFREGKKWMKDADEASWAVEEEIEAGMALTDGTTFSYSPGTECD